MSRRFVSASAAVAALVGLGCSDAPGGGFSTPGESATCVELSLCCSELRDADDAEACEDTAWQDDARSCSLAIADFCASTPSTRTPNTSSDAGSTRTPNASSDAGTARTPNASSDAGTGTVGPTSTPAKPASNTPTAPGSAGKPSAGAPVSSLAPCAALDVCCTALTDEEDLEDCQGLVEEADAAECEEAAADFCPATPGTAGGPAACVSLDICCTALTDDEDLEDCQGAVEEADAAACEEAAADFCPATPVPGGAPVAPAEEEEDD
jgi:hypothetical protein